MRWLFWYIRSMFCKHKWDYEEANYETLHVFNYKKIILHMVLK